MLFSKGKDKAVKYLYNASLVYFNQLMNILIFLSVK